MIMVMMMTVMIMVCMRMIAAAFLTAAFSGGEGGSFRRTHFSGQQFCHQFLASRTGSLVDGAMPSTAGAAGKGDFDFLHFHGTIPSLYNEFFPRGLGFGDEQIIQFAFHFRQFRSLTNLFQKGMNHSGIGFDAGNGG